VLECNAMLHHLSPKFETPTINTATEYSRHFLLQCT
jgi:hypothetical protein